MERTNTKMMRNAYAYYAEHCDELPCGLWQAYGTYSKAKENAMDYCLNLARELDGENVRIVGHNSMLFTVGFIGWVDGVKSYIHITKDHDRYMPLEKIDKETGEIINLF